MALILHPTFSNAAVESANRRINERTLPTEIVMEIFHHLLPERATDKGIVYHTSWDDLSSAVCFALTCRNNWHAFKYLHPRLISLYSSSLAPNSHGIGPPRQGYLSAFLHDWMVSSGFRAPNRRHLQNDIPLPYLSVAVYGATEGGDMEEALMKRLKDWDRKRFFTGIVTVDGAEMLRFPNPRGMGCDWYPAACQMLKYTILGMDPRATVSIQDAPSSWLSILSYGVYHRAWNTYKDSALRNWVEARPEAREYRRVKLGMPGDLDDSKCDRMIDGFAMLRLISYPINGERVV
ncbi:hypothetical protein NHQ30_011694 [Ciborinia camelliae]|nr:hypothetical protein NHQ30_011694 [Ciborinia camelliae]